MMLSLYRRPPRIEDVVARFVFRGSDRKVDIIVIATNAMAPVGVECALMLDIPPSLFQEQLARVQYVFVHLSSCRLGIRLLQG